MISERKIEYKVEWIASYQETHIKEHSLARDEQGKPLEEYTYHIDIEKMDKLGKQGWEFCHLLSQGPSNDMGWPVYNILFKRVTEIVKESL